MKYLNYLLKLAIVFFAFLPNVSFADSTPIYNIDNSMNESCYWGLAPKFGANPMNYSNYSTFVGGVVGCSMEGPRLEMEFIVQPTRNMTFTELPQNMSIFLNGLLDFPVSGFSAVPYVGVGVGPGLMFNKSTKSLFFQVKGGFSYEMVYHLSLAAGGFYADSFFSLNEKRVGVEANLRFHF